MLNPSDEEVRQSPQAMPSQFSSDKDIPPSRNLWRAPVSRQSKKSPRSGTHTRRSSKYRPAYSTEEQHFIWYLRNDVGYLWPDLLDAFNARFSRNGGRRGLSGLQCRYYRLLGQYGIPQVRMLRNADVVQRYGMKANLASAENCVTYPWLSGQYPNNAYGEVLDGKITSSFHSTARLTSDRTPTAMRDQCRYRSKGLLRNSGALGASCFSVFSMNLLRFKGGWSVVSYMSTSL